MARCSYFRQEPEYRAKAMSYVSATPPRSRTVPLVIGFALAWTTVGLFITLSGHSQRSIANTLIGICFVQALVATGIVIRRPARHRTFWWTRLGKMTLLPIAGWLHWNSHGQWSIISVLVILSIAGACDGVSVGYATLPALRLRETRVGAVLAASGYLVTVALLSRLLVDWDVRRNNHHESIFVVSVLTTATVAVIIGPLLIVRFTTSFGRMTDLLFTFGAIITVGGLLLVSLLASPAHREARLWLPIGIAYSSTIVAAAHPGMHKLAHPAGLLSRQAQSRLIPTIFAIILLVNPFSQYLLDLPGHRGDTASKLALLALVEFGCIVASVVAVAHWRRGELPRFFAREHSPLDRDVASGIVTGQFRPMYQAITRVSDGALTGFEALARWQHPRHGLLEASKFMASVRRAGLSEVFDHMMIRYVADDLKRLLTFSEVDEVIVSVNVGVCLFQQTGFAADLLRDFATRGIDSHGLTLEITEVGAIELWSPLIENVRLFQQRGVWIALDDFGAGFANFGHLNRFDPDIVKLDMSVVHACMKSNRGYEVAKAAVASAHACRALIIAEGVEDRAWADTLRILGVTHLQGFAFDENSQPAVWDSTSRR